jgi:hypothetical protein
MRRDATEVVRPTTKRSVPAIAINAARESPSVPIARRPLVVRSRSEACASECYCFAGRLLRKGAVRRVALALAGWTMVEEFAALVYADRCVAHRDAVGIVLAGRVELRNVEHPDFLEVRQPNGVGVDIAGFVGARDAGDDAWRLATAS